MVLFSLLILLQVVCLIHMPLGGLHEEIMQRGEREKGCRRPWGNVLRRPRLGTSVEGKLEIRSLEYKREGRREHGLRPAVPYPWYLHGVTFNYFHDIHALFLASRQIQACEPHPPVDKHSFLPQQGQRAEIGPPGSQRTDHSDSGSQSSSPSVY